MDRFVAALTSDPGAAARTTGARRVYGSARGQPWRDCRALSATGTAFTAFPRLGEGRCVEAPFAAVTDRRRNTPWSNHRQGPPRQGCKRGTQQGHRPFENDHQNRLARCARISCVLPRSDSVSTRSALPPLIEGLANALIADKAFDSNAIIPDLTSTAPRESPSIRAARFLPSTRKCTRRLMRHLRLKEFKLRSASRRQDRSKLRPVLSRQLINSRPTDS